MDVLIATLPKFRKDHVTLIPSLSHYDTIIAPSSFDWKMTYPFAYIFYLHHIYGIQLRASNQQHNNINNYVCPFKRKGHLPFTQDP